MEAGCGCKLVGRSARLALRELGTETLSGEQGSTSVAFALAPVQLARTLTGC